MSARTYLFVPGNRPERFAKAFASATDRVVIDLEDAVAPEAKAGARAAVADWARSASAADLARVVLRTNDVAAPGFSDDLRLLQEARIPVAMLPKSEAPTHVAVIIAAAPAVRVLPLLESARGIAQAQAMAAAPGVERLVFGTLDLALDLGLDIAEDNEPLVHSAGCLVLASRMAGLQPPVAGVTPQLDDAARLLSDLHWSRRRGFGAKLCIHPSQVQAIHDALAPSAEAVAWARRVLQADAASPGAARLDGRMIDRPVVLQAQRTLQLAGL